MDFPWNKPASYGGTPMAMEPPWDGTGEARGPCDRGQRQRHFIPCWNGRAEGSLSLGRRCRWDLGYEAIEAVLLYLVSQIHRQTRFLVFNPQKGRYSYLAQLIYVYTVYIYNISQCYTVCILYRLSHWSHIKLLRYELFYLMIFCYMRRCIHNDIRACSLHQFMLNHKKLAGSVDHKHTQSITTSYHPTSRRRCHKRRPQFGDEDHDRVVFSGLFCGTFSWFSPRDIARICLFIYFSEMSEFG